MPTKHLSSTDKSGPKPQDLLALRTPKKKSNRPRPRNLLATKNADSHDPCPELDAVLHDYALKFEDLGSKRREMEAEKESLRLLIKMKRERMEETKSKTARLRKALDDLKEARKVCKEDGMSMGKESEGDLKMVVERLLRQL